MLWIALSQARSLHAVVSLVVAVVAALLAALLAAEAAVLLCARVPIRPARVGVLDPVGVGGGGACGGACLLLVRG